MGLAEKKNVNCQGDEMENEKGKPVHELFEIIRCQFVKTFDPIDSEDPKVEQICQANVNKFRKK